jgi:hypothetical protein
MNSIRSFPNLKKAAHPSRKFNSKIMAITTSMVRKLATYVLLFLFGLSNHCCGGCILVAKIIDENSA